MPKAWALTQHASGLGTYLAYLKSWVLSLAQTAKGTKEKGGGGGEKEKEEEEEEPPILVPIWTLLTLDGSSCPYSSYSRSRCHSGPSEYRVR